MSTGGEEQAVSRVLVVDDHRMVAEGLAEAIDGEDDLEVVAIAYTGAEAIVAAQVHRPDVVVVDHRLTDMDGLDVTVQILADRPGTQVVMITSVLSELTLLKAIDVGCAAFVVKHSPISEVISAVRAAARGEAVVSPALLARVLPRLQSGWSGPGAQLTPREREVLQLLADGRSNQEIADQLFLSRNTVRNHVQNALAKLNAHSKLEAVAIARREGIVDRM